MIFSMSSIERKTYSSIERRFCVHSPIYSFVMGLPVVNTSLGRQYQPVCTIKYSTSNGSYLVGCHFKFIFKRDG